MRVKHTEHVSKKRWLAIAFALVRKEVLAKCKSQNHNHTGARKKKV